MWFETMCTEFLMDCLKRAKFGLCNSRNDVPLGNPDAQTKKWAILLDEYFGTESYIGWQLMIRARLVPYWDAGHLLRVEDYSMAKKKFNEEPNVETGLHSMKTTGTTFVIN